MADGINLREFLIELGFNVDKKSYSDMEAAVRAGALQANILFAALEGMVEQFSKTVGSFADNLNALYFDSKILKTTASELYVFEQAAARVGRSAQQARGDIASFAVAMRSDPLAKGIAESFTGLSDSQFSKLSQTEKFVDFLQGLSHQSEMVQRIFAEKLHIDYETLKRYEQPEFIAGLKQAADQLARMGADVNKNAEAGHALDETWIQLQQKFDDFSHSDGVTDFMTQLNTALSKLDDWIEAHSRDLNELSVPFVHLSEGILGPVGAIAAVRALVLAIKGLFALAPPPWLVALAAGYQAVELAKHPGDLGYYLNPFASNEARSKELQQRDNGSGSGAPPTPPSSGGDTRNWWQRTMPTWAGGKEAPTGSAAPAHGSASQLKNAQESYAYWRSQGLSDAAAKALVGDEARESLLSGKPLTHWDVSHTSGGLMQWDPSRRAAILAATGIDVWSKSTTHMQQLQAARWEMEHGKGHTIYGPIADWNALKNAKTQADAMRAIVAAEAPADAGAEVNRRLALAASWGARLGVTPAAAAEALKRFPVGGSAGSLSPFFDTGALGAFSPQPSSVTDNSKHSALDQKTTIQLFGVGEGNVDLGAKIARYQSGVNADAIRNLSNNSVG